MDMEELNQERFEALDIFRGMTIGLMIVVNTPGSWSDRPSPPLVLKTELNNSLIIRNL